MDYWRDCRDKNVSNFFSELGTFQFCKLPFSSFSQFFFVSQYCFQGLCVDEWVYLNGSNVVFRVKASRVGNDFICLACLFLASHEIVFLFGWLCAIDILVQWSSSKFFV